MSMSMRAALKAVIRYARHTDDCDGDVHHGHCTCGKDETVVVATRQLAAIRKHDNERRAEARREARRLTMANKNPGLRRTNVGDALRTSKVSIMKHSDIRRCPHYIIAPEHYRADGSCLCDDPNATIMADWGYEWSATSKQWESPQ